MELHSISSSYIADCARYFLGISSETESGRWFTERAKACLSDDVQMTRSSAAQVVANIIQMYEMKLLEDKLDAGEVIKVGKNQIFRDKTDTKYPYVVEIFEFYEDYYNGKPMYSVLDGFVSFKEAYDAASWPPICRRRIRKKVGESE